jgi:hypothetical protein
MKIKIREEYQTVSPAMVYSGPLTVFKLTVTEKVKYVILYC